MRTQVDTTQRILKTNNKKKGKNPMHRRIMVTK
jgi:hypothetical protein